MSHADVDATNTPEVAKVRSEGVLSRPYRALTLGCVCTILLIAFEAMAIGTAMPAAAEALDGVSLYAFAFSAFFTTSLLGMALSGQWCDRSGPLAPVTAGIAAFSGGLLLSGSAQAMWMFVAGRAAQGLGGGLVIVALYVTVRRAYPEHLRPAALASFSAAWVVPSMTGPVIAGTVTEHLGWRWVFLGITVLVVLPLLVMLPALRAQAGGPPDEGAPASARRFDLRGLRVAGAVALGAGLLQLGGQELRWLSLLPAVAGIALLVPGAVRLMPPGTFRAARGLPSAILLRALISAAYYTTQSFLPLMLISQRGLSYTAAGLALVVSGLLWALGAQLQSRPRMERHRYRLVAWGTVLICGGVATVPAVLLDAVPVWTPAVMLSLGALGMGMVVASVGVVVLRLSEPEEAGGNIAALQAADSLANAVMLTLVGTVFAAFGGETAGAGHGPDAEATSAVGPEAFVAVYALAAVAAVLAIAVGRRVNPR